MDCFRTMFHRIAGCIKWARDLLRGWVWISLEVCMYWEVGDGR
jgi:hypothetical protein